MSAAPTTGRIVALDMARSAALLGMAVFHFVYDLEMFGHLPARTATTGGWRVLSIAVAGAFLCLAGVSLVLAHGNGVRWRAFARRFVRIAGAAGLVTAGTYVAFPHGFVYFGILHSIALASLIGLAFLRLHAGVALVTAGLVWLLPRIYRTDALPGPWLDWLGLSHHPRPSVDFEPVFPWLAPFLLGLALARLGQQAGAWERLRSHDPPGLLALLAWPGRHSLILYLVHQPVLIALVWLGTAVLR
ncbi:hypothetical protein RGUI_3418 [Rhodovulum sp. P5]|uniref:heparan-alpha-glucosaminide N-acetyltransferase n=1 Tax=Rhodovulum sp. P5 TaxID=1564506 RepID=UPI0009C1CF85|nr:heparan-alpha-glucosaminide N-acetyltransferase [Rhodovulum sp. P5]ARE41559.1 hypothetical protein RGUI_3418 [Rhodovulum sp. P5]